MYIYFGTYQFSWYTVGSHQHFTAILTNLPYQIKFVCMCMCCCFILFNKIPVKEGEFLNFDCSVHPSRTEELSTFTGSFAKPHSLRRVPPPQGMADDRCIIKKELITQAEFNWYLNNLSPLLLKEVYKDYKWEFKFWYWGLKGLLPCGQRVHFHYVNRWAKSRLCRQLFSFLPCKRDSKAKLSGLSSNGASFAGI